MEYAFYQLAWFFLIYSFLGWFLETALAAVRRGRLLNRGFLNAPFSPSYGLGAVLFAVFLPDLRADPFFLFLGGMLLATALELLTGMLLEKLFGQKWWDYSEQLSQIRRGLGPLRPVLPLPRQSPPGVPDAVDSPLGGPGPPPGDGGASAPGLAELPGGGAPAQRKPPGGGHGLPPVAGPFRGAGQWGDPAYPAAYGPGLSQPGAGTAQAPAGNSRRPDLCPGLRLL